MTKLLAFWIAGLALACGHASPGPAAADLCPSHHCSEAFQRLLGSNTAESLNQIGEALHFGQGVDQDYAAARVFYLRASEAGSAVAANHLGRIYLNGEGVPNDAAEACRWYRLSSSRGDPQAATNAERVCRP